METSGDAWWPSGTLYARARISRDGTKSSSAISRRASPTSAKNTRPQRPSSSPACFAPSARPYLGLSLHADRAFAEIALCDLHVHARWHARGERGVERRAELFDLLDPESFSADGLDHFVVAR